MPPSHSSSLSSTWSNRDLDSDGVTGAGPPGLWSLLNAASHYDQDSLEDDEDSEETESTDTPSDDRSFDEEKLSPVHEIVSSEISPIARLAQLTVNNYNLPVATSSPDSVVAPLPAPREGPDPAVVLKVIQREFGVIAREGEEEEFFREVDAALVFDTTILVRIHS